MSLRLSKNSFLGRRGDPFCAAINDLDLSYWPGRLVSQRANLACRHIIEPVIFCLAHVAGMLTRHAVGEKRFQDAKRYGYAGLMVGGMIPNAIRNIFSGTLRGYNDTAFASLSALFSVIGEGMLTSVSLGFGSSLDA